MRNREIPAISGAPKKLKILANWEDLVERKCLGIDEEVALNERERSWGGRERVVEMFVVLFGDLEDRHA